MRLAFSLPLLAALLLSAGTSYAQIGGSRGISGLERSDTPRVLPADEAFPYFFAEASAGQLTLTWSPAGDHYLYRHRFAFELSASDGTDARSLDCSNPAGTHTEDEFFGAVEVYYDPVSVVVDLGSRPLDPNSVLTVRFQGCASWGFCYPPQTREIRL